MPKQLSMDDENMFTDMKSQHFSEKNLTQRMKMPKAPTPSTYQKGVPSFKSCLATNDSQGTETNKGDTFSVDITDKDLRPQQMSQINIKEPFPGDFSASTFPFSDNQTETEEKIETDIKTKTKQCISGRIVSALNETHQISCKMSSCKNKSKGKVRVSNCTKRTSVTRREAQTPKNIPKTGMSTKENYKGNGVKGSNIFKSVTRITSLRMRSPSKGNRSTWLICQLILAIVFLFACCELGDCQHMYDQQMALLNYSAKTFSACTTPPKECPNSDDDKAFHIFCINLRNGCEDGFYFCDQTAEGWLVEGCFERNICQKGKTNRIGFTRVPLEVKLVCRDCPKGLIQQNSHDSMDHFEPGCDVLSVSLNILNNKDKMKKVSNGTTAEPDLYVCDTSLGYSNAYKFSLCSVLEDCFCVNSVVCSEEKPELLPNGTCDYQCSVERNIFDNFSCSQYTTTVATSGRTTPKSSTSTTETQEVQAKGDQGSNNIPLVIGVVLSSLILTAISSGVAIYCLKNIRNHERRIQGVERGRNTQSKIHVECENYFEGSGKVIIRNSVLRTPLLGTVGPAQQNPDIDGPVVDEEDQTHRKHLYDSEQEPEQEIDGSIGEENDHDQTHVKNVYGNGGYRKLESQVDHGKTKRKVMRVKPLNSQKSIKEQRMKNLKDPSTQ